MAPGVCLGLGLELGSGSGRVRVRSGLGLGSYRDGAWSAFLASWLVEDVPCKNGGVVLVGPPVDGVHTIDQHLTTVNKKQT